MIVVVEPPELCPRCGSPVLYGYGLCGGGVGSYKVCSGEKDDECTFFKKQQDDRAAE